MPVHGEVMQVSPSTPTATVASAKSTRVTSQIHSSSPRNADPKTATFQGTKAKQASLKSKFQPSRAASERAYPALLRTCRGKRSIVVFKAQRRLELRCGEKLVGRYNVGLGFEPTGHKQREGDGRTPEGTYGIAFKHYGQFHRALRISYPNRADAEAGLADGRINRHEYAAIRAAHQRCVQPPQTTELGSLLEVHGGGSAGDWTLGCVALSNPAIEKVYRFHQAGCLADGSPRTPLHIHP